MLNNKIEINEDSELHKLTQHNNSSKVISNDKIIYSLQKLIRNKIFLYIISISIICLTSYIIISNLIPLKDKSDEHIIIYNKYDSEGIRIYKNTGKLSFNKLDELIYGNKNDYSRFNNIHIAMSFDNDYYLLSSATIASLLKNSNKST